MNVSTLLSNIKILKGHEGSVYKIIFDPLVEKLYSAGGDGWLVEWDPYDSDNGILLARVPDQIFSLRVTAEFFVLGSFQGNFYVLDREERKILHKEKVHKGGIFDLYSDEENIYSFGGDGRLIQWDKTNFEKRKIIPLSNKSLRTFARDPVRQELAVGSSDGSVYILRYPELYLIRQIENAHHPTVFSLLFDGDRLLSGGRDARINIWSPGENYSLIAGFNAHWYAVYDIIRTEDFIVTGSRDKSIRWWNPVDLTPVVTVKWGEIENAHVHSINSLAYDSRSNVVFSGSDDRTIRLWQIRK